MQHAQTILRSVFPGVLATLSLLSGPAARADTAQAPERCPLYEFASVDTITLPNGKFEIPVSFNGKIMPLLLDTGAIQTVITSEAAAELGVTRQMSRQRGVLINNVVISQKARIDDIQIGGLHAQYGWDVMIMPDNVLAKTEFGLMGPDFFATDDVEIDYFRGKFNVFRHNKCDGNVVYWTRDPYAAVPIITADGSHHIEVQAALDGKPLKATFDTGAETSIMSLDVARQLFGLAPTDPRIQQLGTERINHGAPTAMYKFPFGALTFNGVQVTNPQIILIPADHFLRSNRGGDINLILGASVLRQLHLYIDYPGKMVYLTSAEAH